MIIKNTNFCIIYPKIQSLRRKIVESEDKLSSFFLPSNILPIPDDAPEEIPRISMATKNGHSTLNLSLTASSLVTNYDKEFSNSWEKCEVYLKERVNNVYNILDTLKQDKFLFNGLSTQILFDDIQGDPVTMIKEKLLNLKTNANPYDLSCKITFIYESNYYINVTFENIRLYEGLLSSANASISSLEEKAHLMSITLDVNDRYSYNYNNDYSSDYSKVIKIFDITTDIINNKLGKLISEGVFEL